VEEVGDGGGRREGWKIFAEGKEWGGSVIGRLYCVVLIKGDNGLSGENQRKRLQIGS
jgi:hypothetical protein